MTEEDKHYNYYQLRPGVYIVRSGAGFRKALFRFGAYSEEFDEIENPSTYPCLVFLQRVEGQKKITCTSVHVNTLYAGLEKIDGPIESSRWKARRKTQADADKQTDATTQLRT